MGDFYQYYSGEKQAPVLTLVIGGNHEASNYFSELYYGGWLAPNIYYLGAANVLRYGPLRIAGLSGIFNRADYRKPHHERLPYDRNEIRSIYHVRECDVSKLLQIRSPIDIGISHDWPRRIEWFGDYKKLFDARPSFLESAKVDGLGSPPAEQILNFIRPRYWFSAHMHVKYSAIVEHKDDMNGDIIEDLAVSDELKAQLPASMFETVPKEKRRLLTPSPPGITNTVTHFLALDKPGPDREFLVVIETEPCSAVEDASAKPYMQKTTEGKYALFFDEEWLSIIRSSGKASTVESTFHNVSLDQSDADRTDTAQHNLRWVQANVTTKDLQKIPENFGRHAPIYDPSDDAEINEQPCDFPNFQTQRFCSMLQIWHPLSVDEDVAEVDNHIVFE